MMAAIKAWYAQLAGGTVVTGTVGGTADAITLTNSPTVDALATGQRYLFKYTSTGNTGAVTLNVDGLGATALRYKDVALVSGDIATNDWVFCYYDGTRFQMLNHPRLSWGTTDIPTDATGGAVGDLFVFADASESNALNKVTLQKMFDNALTGLTADTSPDVADSLFTYDASATAAKTTTITNFFKAINALTADATPDGSADYVATYDASATAAKKVLIQNFAATQAQQETGTAVTNFVTPGRQQYHQSASKAWGTYDQSSTVATLASPSYNISSITDGATGKCTLNWTTAFSTAVYELSGGSKSNSTFTNAPISFYQVNTQAKTTTTAPVTTCYFTDSSAAESPDVNFQAFGDQ